jgi:hypothetical protein
MAEPPLRNTTEWFVETDKVSITFPVAIPDEYESALGHLSAMTPYQWHAPIDLNERLTALTPADLEIFADIQVTVYKHTSPERRVSKTYS